MTSLFDVRGKVALVTGGAHGLGRMIAAGLATAGARSTSLPVRRKLRTAALEIGAHAMACDREPEAAAAVANHLRAARAGSTSSSTTRARPGAPRSSPFRKTGLARSWPSTSRPFHIGSRAVATAESRRHARRSGAHHQHGLARRQRRRAAAGVFVRSEQGGVASSVARLGG